MDYLKSYKSFINSHYLTEGIRMTAGILLPAFIMSYYNLLSTGIVISVGALCVSMMDNAGPIHHRRTGMLVCNAAIFIVTLSVGFTTHSPLLLGIILFIFCFFFSMLGVYGFRAGSIGIAALLVMILHIDNQQEGWDVVWNALYILGGGIWYMIFSLVLYSVRPYKLAQQALGDCIQSIGDYLRTRASFYDKQVDYDAAYRNLLQQQVLVQEKQDLGSELLFKTRDIIKESTHTGRILIMIYLDVADLFERIMTSYQNYSTLHDFFDDTTILFELKILALDLAKELDEIGISLKSGESSEENPELHKHISDIIEHSKQLRQNYLKPDNVEGFISLRRILDNIQDIADRIHTLHFYTTYDRKIRKQAIHRIDYDKFISHRDITPEIFFDNINFQSNIFRHSLRVSIAVLAGYLMALLFDIGHSYWILLTIIVILKPEYSLTKKRNADRLIGTLCGVLIGAVVLYFIKNNTILLLIMIALMAGTYTFIRKHYFIGVLLMTPYIILFFYLLNPDNFKYVLIDRVIDTAIGSVIAFAASLFLVPAWEHTTIKTYIIGMLEKNIHYFSTIATAFGEQINTTTVDTHQVSRKKALVALANLSNAFNRMLSEPKSKQIGISQVHQFVVLNHMLTSHIATLSYYLQAKITTYRSEKFASIGNDIIQHLTNAIAILEGKEPDTKMITQKDSLRQLNEQANALLETRRKELQRGHLETATRKSLLEMKSVVDQFNFIYKIVADIAKISYQLSDTSFQQSVRSNLNLQSDLPRSLIFFQATTTIVYGA